MVANDFDENDDDEVVVDIDGEEDATEDEDAPEELNFDSLDYRRLDYFDDDEEIDDDDDDEDDEDDSIAPAKGSDPAANAKTDPATDEAPVVIGGPGDDEIEDGDEEIDVDIPGLIDDSSDDDDDGGSATDDEIALVRKMLGMGTDRDDEGLLEDVDGPDDGELMSIQLDEDW